MRALKKKTVKKRLSTGHTVELVATDVKLIRNTYEYMAGFVKRRGLLNIRAKKEAEVAQVRETLGNSSSKADEGDTQQDLISRSFGDSLSQETTGMGEFGVDLRTEQELLQDRYFQIKEELRVLNEKVANFNKHEHKISSVDLDAILKGMGAPHSAKAIEYMIWEVDEHGDGVIDWDEFLLTYFRNIQKDNNGQTEPNNFFNILEFISFDPTRKGFIMEDDVMETLFSRYGSARLEKELLFIFGNNLRSKGGEGTIDLTGYLAAVLHRTGRRAILNTV